MDKARKRRWSFSLKALLVAITALAVGLGLWESSVIRRRARFMGWVQSHRGFVQLYAAPQSRKPVRIGSFVYGGGQQVKEKERHIQAWRARLGDVPVSAVGLPAGSGESKRKQAQSLFPEADVYVVDVGVDIPMATAEFSRDDDDDPFSVGPTPSLNVKDPWMVSERPTP
jgi:hypothetical protein